MEDIMHSKIGTLPGASSKPFEKSEKASSQKISKSEKASTSKKG
jgi:hypothetical protein